MKPIADPSDVMRCFGFPHANELPDLADDIARLRVLLEGHFELQSGRHSRFFIRFAGIGWQQKLVERLAPVLVSSAGLARGAEVTVLAPESAGLLLARAVADYLGAPLAVAAIDEQRRPTRYLRHGSVAPGRRIIIVNDVITTGKSLDPLFSAPQTAVAGLLSFAASGDAARRIEQQRGIRAQWLASIAWGTFEPSSCPLCADDQEPVLPAAEFN